MATTSIDITDLSKQTSRNEELYYLGVDIGGTKVSAGIVNGRGEILFTAKGPMTTEGSADDGLMAVKGVVDEILAGNGTRPLGGIGVSAPGPVDPLTGRVANPCNLPCWRDFPLRNEMELTYHLPVWVDNDANAAGLAEALWGAAAGFDSVFYASIGTGIGTAIVLSQSVYHGPTRRRRRGRTHVDRLPRRRELQLRQAGMH
ncbi:MAG: ROK family protein [Terriglobales bacterium]